MQKRFFTSTIETPIGPLVAISDATHLYLLEFEVQIGRHRFTHLETAMSSPIAQISDELEKYFSKQLRKFATPLVMEGTPFQKEVWENLVTVSYGETKSYGELANLVGNPKGQRAVAGANARNPIAIVVPCHRIINANGALGGYAGKVERKKWLLEHEGGRNDRW